MHSGKNDLAYLNAGRQSLLSKHIQVIQSLHVHEVVIHREKVRHADDRRNQDVPDCLTHRYLPPSIKLGLVRLAGALDAGKPIEKPQAYGAGDVKYHLADFYL
jgi:hypothetical protein